MIKDGKELLEIVDLSCHYIWQDEYRPYLGMSSLGYECLRKIYFSWRFAGGEKLTGRKKRLLNRGHLEEPRVVDYLRCSGFFVHDVDPRTGKQFEFTKHHGHVKGHCDGTVFLNYNWHTLEIKTHADVYFKKVKKINDLKISMPEHYSQIQQYMHEQGLELGLYVAVNKNNDALHFEFIERDEVQLAWIWDREIEILTSQVVPFRISENEGYWQCNICRFKGICFHNEPVNHTCRLCQHIEMIKEGGWFCRKRKTHLTLKEQLMGCRKLKYVLGL